MKLIKFLVPLIFLGLYGNLYSQTVRISTQNIGAQVGLGLNIVKTDKLTNEIYFGLSTRDGLFMYPTLTYHCPSWLYTKFIVQPHFRAYGIGHQVYGDNLYAWITLGIGAGVEKGLKNGWGLYAEVLCARDIPHRIHEDKSYFYPLISLGVWYKILDE